VLAGKGVSWHARGGWVKNIARSESQPRLPCGD
jgi:hypothetical protein